MSSAACPESQDFCHATDPPLKFQDYLPDQIREERLPSVCTCAATAGGCGDGNRDSGPLALNQEIGSQRGHKGCARKLTSVKHRNLHSAEAELDETGAIGKSPRADACRNPQTPLELEVKGTEEDDKVEEKDDREKDDVTSLRLKSKSRQTWNFRHINGTRHPVDGPKLAWASPGTERKVRITIIRSKKAHGDSAKAILSTAPDLSFSQTTIKDQRRTSDAVQKEEERLTHITADRKRNSWAQTHQCTSTGINGKSFSQTIEPEQETGARKQIRAESKGQVASSAETPMANTAARLQGSGDQPGCPSAESQQEAKKDDLLDVIFNTYIQTPNPNCSNSQNVKFKPKGIFSKWVGHTKRALKFKSTKQNGLAFKVSQDVRPSAPDSTSAETPQNEPTKSCPSPPPVSKTPERNLTEMFAARSCKQSLTTMQKYPGSSST